jgi:hypothetical protein
MFFFGLVKKYFRLRSARKRRLVVKGELAAAEASIAELADQLRSVKFWVTQGERDFGDGARITFLQTKIDDQRRVVPQIQGRLAAIDQEISALGKKKTAF